MRLVIVTTTIFIFVALSGVSCRSLQSTQRRSLLSRQPVLQKSRTFATDERLNTTKPGGVFLFDNNCMWYLHGKGKLIAKINCVNPKKKPPVIVAQRKNGKIHYKLQRGIRKRPWRFNDKNKKKRRSKKGGQIPLKCYYRYDDKGVFYLTTCYTHSRQFGPIEMNFQGHRPGEKVSRRKNSQGHRPGEKVSRRKNSQSHRPGGKIGRRKNSQGHRPGGKVGRRKKHRRRGRRPRKSAARIRKRMRRRRRKLRRVNKLNEFLQRTVKPKTRQSVETVNKEEIRGKHGDHMVIFRLFEGKEDKKKFKKNRRKRKKTKMRFASVRKTD